VYYGRSLFRCKKFFLKKKEKETGLPGQKIKKARFGHKQFQKSQIIKNEKGQIKAKFSLNIC
jgi:hypothetical protein